MAIKSESITIQYIAWNTLSNCGETGDSANHTLRVITDGTAAAASNAPSEIDATNAPGVYKITLTAGEMAGDYVSLVGKSSTANVVIIPVSISTERGIVSTNLDATVSSRSSHSAADVTGGTTVADAESNIRGADSDTLETLSDQLDGTSTFDPSSQAVDVGSVNGTSVTSPDDLKADISTLATSAALSALETHGDTTWTTADVSALATAAALSTVDGIVDAIKAVTDQLPDNGALTSIATAAALATVDTVVDAIKAKTDQLAFTDSTIDANVDSVEASISESDIADIADAVWDETAGDHTTEGTTGEALNTLGTTGATQYTYTAEDGDGLPIDGCRVWITTDQAGSDLVQGPKTTNASGEATFVIDDGDYYIWREKSGYNITPNPVAETIG